MVWNMTYPTIYCIMPITTSFTSHRFNNQPFWVHMTIIPLFVQCTNIGHSPFPYFSNLRRWQIQLIGMTTVLIISKSHVNILFIIEMNIVMLLKQSYSLPPPDYIDYRVQNDHHNLNMQLNLLWTHVILIRVLPTISTHTPLEHVSPYRKPTPPNIYI